MPFIMIVDDEPFQRQQLEAIMLKMGHRAIVLNDGQKALEYIRENKQPAPDVVLLDLFMPGMDGVNIISKLKALNENLPIIALSMHGTVRLSLQAIKAGAYDFIPKPASPERLEVTVNNAIRAHHLSLGKEGKTPVFEYSLQLDAYTGYSDKWRDVIRKAALVANQDGTLIIEGESGSGKMTLARAIHRHGKRTDKPLVVTDTRQDIPALNKLLESAQGGTLIVHHFGRAPEGFFYSMERLYGYMSEQDIRLILCHQTSPAVVAQELVERMITRNRPDAIAIPPLRERRQDIILQATRFLKQAAALLGRDTLRLSPAAAEAITYYDWPDNLRQLNAELFDLILYSKHSELPIPACCTPSSGKQESPMIQLMDMEGNLRSLEDIESEIINFALNYCKTSRSDIARMLGIGRTTLYRKAHLLHA